MMNWLELKNFIAKMDKDTLKSKVMLYDYSNGEEYDVDITELLCEKPPKKETQTGWVPYLCIN